MTGDIQNIRAGQRLPPGDDQQAPFVHFRDLINEAVAFVGRQLVRAPAGFGGCVQVAMGAFEVTPFGEIQGDQERLEVIHRPAVVGSRKGTRRDEPFHLLFEDVEGPGKLREVQKRK